MESTSRTVVVRCGETDASFDKFGSDAWTHGRCSFEPGGAKVAPDTCSSDGELQ